MKGKLLLNKYKKIIAKCKQQIQAVKKGKLRLPLIEDEIRV